MFDVPSASMLGSYPVSGTGSYQGTPIGAGSNDDGTVMAFASWGTQFHDWPEVMVFNRSVQLIGQINFPGSAFSVDVATDGQYVVGGAKAVHANQFGNGGRIELIQLQTSPTPTPTPTPHAVDVTWDQSPSTDVQSYKVYRGQKSGGPYVSVSGTLPATTLLFKDTSVHSGQTYFYVVTSVDINGLESEPSPEASAQIPP